VGQRGFVKILKKEKIKNSRALTSENFCQWVNLAKNRRLASIEVTPKP
jgi:hypothetical protein